MMKMLGDIYENYRNDSLNILKDTFMQESQYVDKKIGDKNDTLFNGIAKKQNKGKI